MKLHIFDVKQMMYIGQSKHESVCRGVIEDQVRFRPREIRVGSICYLFDRINGLRHDQNNVLAFCCDSRPTFKIDLEEKVLNIRYKGGRSATPPHVAYQYDFCIELLKQIGFNVYKEDSYEADDFISSLVYKYKNVFDEIIIHTNDSDQYYLISSNVRCEPASNNCRAVNLSNYELACSKKRNTPYNRVMLDKILYGEDGDNIPGFNYDDITRVNKIIPSVVYKYLGDAKLLRTILKAITQNDERYMAITDLVIPRLILDERCTISADAIPDWNLFTYYASQFGCIAFRNMNVTPSEIGESTIINEIDKLVDNGVI